jgi:hypothetical protein
VVNEVESRLRVAGDDGYTLIGNGCDGLILSNPPKSVIEARQRRANAVAEGDSCRSIANPAKCEPGDE